LKKSRWILLSSVLLLLLVVAFVFKRSPGGTGLPSLRPYIAKERVIYFNPADLMKSSSFMTGGPPPPGSMEPVMFRQAKIRNLKFDQLEKLIHKDLDGQKDWTFQPMPGIPTPTPTTGLSKADLELLKQYIVVTKGSASPGSSALFGMFGGSEHSLMIMPDFGGSLRSGSMKSEGFSLMEIKQLSRSEVLLLRLKSLGKNPFASEKDIMAIGNDF
jgi:hypothetical protein